MMRGIYRESAPNPPSLAGNNGEGKYRLTVEERPMYTYARIHSTDVNFRPTGVHLARILKQCSLTACERIVIENQSCTAFSRVDFLQTATQFPGYGLTHTRVAIVDVYDARREKQGLNIVIGKSSSISVAVFPNITEAEAWLFAH
ncbi:MAG: hypothetical protein ABJA02_16870 [Acidobacteriota bacterium]